MGFTSYESPFSRVSRSYSGSDYKILVEKLPSDFVYLIVVKHSCETEMEVSDSLHSKFIFSELDSKICYQYTMLENPREDYTIVINQYPLQIGDTLRMNTR